GVGDFAIRYGYQRYEYDIMYVTIALIVVLVMLIQTFGTRLSMALDHRSR
ncbi:ABC transporter permease, partial [Nesterenkonia sp. E16_7]|nr:ABC transporter permease [Nesterenkonia sp. E16_7]